MPLDLDLKSKPKNRRKKSRTIVPWRRFQRFLADIRSASGESCARVLLHDLGPEGIGLFVDRKFERGEKIEILLHTPRPFQLKGNVRWCAEIPRVSKLIQIQECRYRIGVLLEFDTAEARSALEVFCVEFAIQLRVEREKKS